jgi:peptidoglycan/xylan/chitin deacetylase (PgdA/CDA1 family)
MTAKQTPIDIKIALTFDFDSYTNWIGSVDATSPSMISRGEFGPIGARRILNLLGDYNVQATFFIPGATAISYPLVVAAIQEAGHEIGHHGWIHENPTKLAEDEECEILEKGIEVLEKVTGVRPVGYRSPSWDNSSNTVRLLLNHGFEYESSMMGNDFEPYWCRIGDKWSKKEPLTFGKPTSLVEMPVAWHLDDWPYFEFIPGQAQGFRTPSMVLEIWKREFDYLYHQTGHGVLIITMHPQAIGRGHRLMMLKEFLEYLISHSGVHFTKCIDYVRTWKIGRIPSLPVDIG